MDDLPYWRVIMCRARDGDPDLDSRIKKMGKEHAETIDEMHAFLREHGVATNRDFDMAERTRTQSYRGRKDSSLALYYLWMTGEVMTHHRENFERVYALTESVAPKHLLHEVSETEADRFLLLNEAAFSGLTRFQRTQDAYFRGVPFSRVKTIRDELLSDGKLVEVKVEGWKQTHYALSSDARLLDDLIAERVPETWTPLETTTTDEVAFLAPLDPVSARGRAKILFDFDYVWEVYKPEEKRQYGYYTLPVLWGERLVARFDSKLDRTTNTFVILGFWLEDEALGKDEAFAVALARGVGRFVNFLGANKLEVEGIQEPFLRKHINQLSIHNPF